jgi:LmbE family N-acetylglucosaminyl deacetylase
VPVVLGIFAHPDDEATEAGGALAWHSRGGGEVHCRFLTNGVGAVREDVSTRLEEMREAAKILGLSTVCVADFTDQQLHLAPETQICRVIEEWLDALKPTILFTHSEHDVNQDHRIVSRAVLVTVRTRDFVRAVYGCEPEWSLDFRPTGHVAIDNVMAYKLAAIASYKSQAKEEPHPRSIRGVIVRAGMRGAWAGPAQYAEAFEPILMR